jgi:mono/diheme cytochrome c family protein
MSRLYHAAPVSLPVPPDSATIARGEHLIRAISKCGECHGQDLGGQLMTLGPLGTFSAANLTRGRGGVGGMSDADWVRAIRHGIRSDGRPLIFMPSQAFNALDSADLGAIIAYVKQVPSVDRELPPTAIGPIGRILTLLKPGRLIPAEGIDHAVPIPADAQPGPTLEYGKYLSVVGGCTYCHGDNLKGGIQEGPPGTPASADLTPAGPTSRWSADDFRQALRNGIRPEGTTINPFMPWRSTRLMTDDEIQAVWVYLRSL